MKKCLIVIFAIVLFFEYYLKNFLNYQDLDCIIKAVTGLGAIGTAWGVYWKWNDEKTRQLYERRLQEVYAPFMKLLIRQETYRKDAKLPSIVKVLEDRNMSPFFRQTTSVTDKKTGDIISIEKFSIINEGFFAILDKNNLSKTSLLVVLEKYRLIWELAEKAEQALEEKFNGYEDKHADDPKLRCAINSSEEGKELMRLREKRHSLEKEIFDEIVNGYNECIKILKMDKQKINFDEENFWENY
jgi:hypothetical protein